MKLRYLKNVVSLSLREERCTGCGMCALVCPHRVLQVKQGRARIVERDACMECGACARNCPTGALYVVAGVGCAAAIIGSRKGGEPPAAVPERTKTAVESLFLL